jgi:hypothetical protein
MAQTAHFRFLLIILFKSETLYHASGACLSHALLLPLNTVQVEVSNLPRGLHARCITFHPLRPVLAVVRASM